MSTFRSLRIRNYRLFASGQVISLVGTWAQRIAQDWLVLELSDDSGVALGLVTTLQFAPVLVFSLWAGVLADRYDKRRLLLLFQAAMGVLALLLGLLDLTGAVTLWQVYLLSFGLGIVTAFDIPTRQAFVVEIVGPDDLPNAIALNSATFNIARIVGPAVAGAVIAIGGTGWVFLGNGISFVAVITVLWLMDAGELFTSAPVERAKGQVREGLAYVMGDTQLSVTVALVAVIGTFGLTVQITMALVAKEVFHSGPGAFGVLSSALAAGSLVGALLSARRTGPARLRTLFASAVSFGMLEILVGFSPTYVVMAVLLVPLGVAILTFTTTAMTLVQVRSLPAMRGRAMAVYILVLTGGIPLGGPLLGWVAEVLGPRWGLWAGAILCLVGTALAGLFLRSKKPAQ